MTPALKLAKECGASDFTNCGGESQVTYMLHTKQLETFYRRAQAQALREAAENFCGATADHLRRMADELENQK